MKKLSAKLFIITVISIILRILFDTHIIKVEKVNVETDKLSDKTALKLLQISDFHNKKSFKTKERIINMARHLAPDFIVLTGDLIDRRTKDFQSVFYFAENIVKLGTPVYFVTGNHEWNHPKKQEFVEGLIKRKIIVLSNENRQLRKNQELIQLAGVDDSATEHEDVERAFYGIDDKRYTILLSHSPYIIKKYSSMPADLILSGHTHGGQIRFPLLGAVISPGAGFFPFVDKGLYRWGDGQKRLYVDSGLGTTKIPLRFLNQSQISLITIHGTRED